MCVLGGEGGGSPPGCQSRVCVQHTMRNAPPIAATQTGFPRKLSSSRFNAQERVRGWGQARGFIEERVRRESHCKQARGKRGAFWRRGGGHP